MSTRPVLARILAACREPVTTLVLLACAPLVLAGLRLVFDGWWPSGDDALIALRATDVWSSHPPVMGQRTTSFWSSAAIAAHHPGPMQYYILGVFGGLAGFAPWGLVLGGVVIGAWSVWAAVSSIGHHLGRWSALAVACAAIGLTTQWGAAMLVRPYNLTSGALPLLAFICLTWVILDGGTRWVPHWVVAGSYTAQSHLGLLPPVLLVVLVVGLVALIARRHHGRWIPVGARRMPWWRRRTTVSIALAVLLWLPSLVETLTYSPSNVHEIWEYSLARSDATKGLRAGLDYVLNLMSDPTAQPLLVGESGTVAIGVVILAVLLVGSLTALRGLARHRRVPRALTGSLLAMLLVAAAAYSVSRLDEDRALFYGAIFLPIAWFAAVAAAVALGHLVASRGLLDHVIDRASAVRYLAPAIVTLAAVLACVGVLRDDNTGANPSVDAFVATVARATPGSGPVRIESPGVQGWVMVAPTLAYRYESEGRGTSMKIFWPIPGDDDHRKLEHAPSDAEVVTVFERNDGTWASGRRPSGTEVARLTIPPGLGFPQADLVATVGAALPDEE